MFSDLSGEQERLAVVGRMASGIVHDVKNAMTVIRCAAELAETRAPEAGLYTGTILEESDRLVDMMEGLLAYARGNRRPEIQSVALPDLIEDALAATALPLERAGVRLSLDVDAAPVELDPGQLRRALVNLINNAVEAMPAGGTLTLRAHLARRSLRIEVADTGSGMTSDQVARLFEPFFTHGKERGTGLGAAVARTVAEAHGGSARAQSVPGEGTIITLLLPQPAPACEPGRAVAWPVRLQAA